MIDTVIHAAALVKHYGDYSISENVNVIGTKEILSFCKRFDARLAHISTVSVSGNSVGGKFTKPEFTENDFYVGQNYMENVYVRSKFEAERLVLNGLKDGVEAYIFRIGNLTSRYSDGLFQKNAEENNFYNVLKSIVNMQKISDELLEWRIDFTPVDLCSKAVVHLLKNGTGGQKVFHIYNHKIISLGELIEKLGLFGFHIDTVSAQDYSKLLKNLSKSRDTRELLAGIVNNAFMINSSQINESIVISSRITCEYLKNMGFEWPEIDEVYIQKVMNYFGKRGILEYAFN